MLDKEQMKEGEVAIGSGRSKTGRNGAKNIEEKELDLNKKLKEAVQ
jgi:hypothetical protein